MKSISAILLLILVWPLLPCQPADAQQPKRRPGPPPPRQPQAPAPIEFLGWDYAKLGYTLTPGEQMALLFRSNHKDSTRIPVAWRLTTYVGEPLSEGQTELKLQPGQTGKVPIPLPQDFKDGAYFVNYSLGDPGRGGQKRFHFDFRRPVPDEKLNLNIVALIENMDAEGWTRMMFGPLARYVNVLSDWPSGDQRVDAVLVIAEVIDDDDPRLARLEEYVKQGGKMLLFGKPAASLADMLPIELAEQPLWQETPHRLQLLAGGPWQGFEPDTGPTHYGLRIEAKENATVLAQWNDGTPAVVSGAYGMGRVVFVGASSDQVWQRRGSLEGADELGMRLLYWMTRGDDSVAAMLDRAEQIFKEETRAKLAIRDRVLAGTDTTPPHDFVVVSRNNVGRFGWLTGEGGLTENIATSGAVSPAASRTFAFRSGSRWSKDDEASFSFAVAGDSTPRASGVEQNWLAKTIAWRYTNGATVRSTLSLASPGILWEGDSTSVWLTCRAATHIAYMSSQGIRIAARDTDIDPADLAEGWLLAFRADPGVRDMPQLFVLTRRPDRIQLADGIRLSYGEGGFVTLFTSRLWGVRRLAPGETVTWAKKIPERGVTAARRWSRAFLSYPVACDEIGWVDGDTVNLADRFRFRTFKSDWDARPLALAPLPPVLLLAQRVGAPIELPGNRIDLDCPTKYGPLVAAPGDTTLVRITLPPRDHRALIPADGRMVLQEQIDGRTAGLRLGQTRAPGGKNEGAGSLHADLAPYDRSGMVPFNEAPCIDPYKWWYTFNALLARPVYSAPVRERVDRHFRTRYWETLNFYPHKCFVMQKREPWTGVEYLIHFVWPTQTQYGFRNFNDGNEASGITAYCFANYARYYGDWATLRANWNHCRRLYEFLPRVNDWACMASGAVEYWQVAGLDMVNSEPWGNLAFAYAAKNAGYPRDELVGLVHGARSLVTAVARFGLKDYLQSITAEGDPWRDFRGHYWFAENGFQASASKMGSIGMHDTSKGTSHELSLAYKTWAPDAIRGHEEALQAAGQNSLPDLTQRLFLGWDPAEIRDRAVNSKPRAMNWTATKDLYDLALACVAEIPLFLSDWAPAEYVRGRYDPEQLELNLTFRSHEGEPYKVRVYSRRAPREVTVNGKALAQSDDAWRYDPRSGWLVIHLDGADEKHVFVRLGEPVAPLHPYFGKATR